MPVSTRGTASQIPSAVQFVAPGAPTPHTISGRTEVDADGDLRFTLVINGVDVYVYYLSDRKGRKDSSNPGLRLNVKPIAAGTPGIRTEQIGAYTYPEINYLTPLGKSYRRARTGQ